MSAGSYYDQAEQAAEQYETEDEREARLDDEAFPWLVLSCVQGSPGVTVYLFRCEDPTGAQHLVGVDHRAAQVLCEVLEAGEGDALYIERPEAWQTLATYPA